MGTNHKLPSLSVHDYYGEF